MFQYEKFILEFPSLLHEDRILHAYLHQSETQRERQRERDTLLSTTEPDNHTTLSQLSLLGIFSPFSYSRLLFYQCLLHWSLVSDYLGNWLLHWIMISDYTLVTDCYTVVWSLTTLVTDWYTGVWSLTTLVTDCYTGVWSLTIPW